MLKTVGNPSTRTGDQTIVDGNLVIGTAAKGVNFTANTPAAGMTNQLMNWYEEGTWTPSLSATSGTITTVGAVSGTYTRIGRQVTIDFNVAITVNGTAAGALVATGLPFTPASDAFGSAREMSATGVYTMAWVEQANSRIVIQKVDAVYAGGSGYSFKGTITYFV